MYGGNDRRHSRPINNSDMKKFLDCEGRLVYVDELRQAIFEGGVEPSFRKVVWRHLLNVFPTNMTGLERIEYLRSVDVKYKTFVITCFLYPIQVVNHCFLNHFFRLKKRWMVDKHKNEHTQLIMRMVEKDVSRTDRAFNFYSDTYYGAFNVKSLFHILVTYCVNHPDITYSQGWYLQ